MMFTTTLIETLYRENWRFRDRDLNGKYHVISKNLDAQLLCNDTSFLSNLLCKSPLIIYSPTIFVRLFQPIHWYETRILTFSSEKRAPISTMFTSVNIRDVFELRRYGVAIVCSVCYDMIFGVYHIWPHS